MKKAPHHKGEANTITSAGRQFLLLCIVCRDRKQKLPIPSKIDTNTRCTQNAPKRMDRALPLLKYTAFSIEEIAAMLGYSNSSNFYKAYKSYYGKSPREYLSVGTE